MNELLKTLGEQPIYVFMFIALMGFLWNSHKASVAAAVQAEGLKSALALALQGQNEANRLRDETNKQNERWLHMFETMNERFLVAISGQTGVISRQGTRLDTMDTSLSSLPKLAAAAQGSDAKTDLIVDAIKQSGADIQAVNRKLGYMGVDMKSIAQYIVNPTAPNKQDVEDIANKPATATQEQPAVSAAPATLAPGDKIEVTGTVSGTVSGTVAPKGETAPA